MLHISQDQAQQLISVPETLDAITEGFRLYGIERNILSRPSAALTVVPSDPPRSFLLKGVALKSLGLIGHSFGLQFGELYFAVCDGSTGELLGLLDQLWLTRRRTGATAAVAARYLAPPDPKVIALIGAGGIGEQAVRCLDHEFSATEFRVASRTVEGAQSFADRLRPDLKADIRAVASPKEAVDGADIIVSITYASEPLIRPGDVKRGALILPMGGAPEVDYGVLPEVSRIVIDDLGYVLLRGSLANWVRGGHISEADLRARIDADIGEVVAGMKPGRRPEDTTVMGVIQGMAVGDLMLAHRILGKAREAAIGTEIPLKRQAAPVSAETLSARTPGIVAGLMANRDRSL